MIVITGLTRTDGLRVLVSAWLSVMSERLTTLLAAFPVTVMVET